MIIQAPVINIKTLNYQYKEDKITRIQNKKFKRK